MTIAKYLRLSAEDGDLRQSGKIESNSIANQRDLLDSFIARTADLSGSKIVEFCDDGWSGKNFERPAVKELLSQTKQGKIQCIIVKDLSRFGRDYLIVGNYISKVFPFLGVRFIAVNDGLDSIRPADVDSLDTSFKALLYDLYSRDLSRKIRSAKRFRAQNGEYMSAKPRYGYARDPAKKNHLVIDPPAAEIVRRIFKMVGDGMSVEKVAKLLNTENIPTPMRYKIANTRFISWHCISEDNFWTPAAVLNIIRDEQYIGSVVNGKRYYDIISQGHSIKVRKKDWIIVPDMHEPIVSKEEYERAQANLLEYKERSVSSGTKSKIRCGVCGHAMERRKAKQPYFRCKTPRVTDAFPCPQERILEDEIYAALLDSLRRYAMLIVETERLCEEQRRSKKEEAAAMRREMRVLQESLAQYKQKSKSLYESFAMGEITKSEYLSAKAAVQKAQEDIEERIGQIGATLDSLSIEDSLRDGIAPEFRKYANVEEMSPEILDDVLDEVRVFPGGRLVIRWKYQDEIMGMLELCES